MITNREQFKKYILTALGQPVIDVNIADQQLQDRIDDAIEYWNNFHHQGTAKVFLKQIVTPSTLKVQTPFKPEDIKPSMEIKGLTSHAISKVSVPIADRAVSGNGIIYCQKIDTSCDHDFISGQMVEIAGKQYKLCDCCDFYTKGIIDERRFKVPDWVMGINKIIPENSETSSQNLFDVQYQLRLSDIYDLTSTSLIYYQQAMQHLDLLNFELSANPHFEFNRLHGYIYPICKWGVDFDVGHYIIMEAYRMLDPSYAPKMWNEPWLKRYATALVKLQWATNLSKYQNIQLPGGITFNGSQMYNQAITQKQTLEQQLLNLMPVNCFFVG